MSIDKSGLIDSPETIKEVISDMDVSITTVQKPNKIEYPFIYVENITEIEFKYLSKTLPDGDVPLMLKSDKMYALIKNTTISLKTIKLLMRFGNKPVWIKESKDVKYPIESIIDALLLESDEDE